ncbi:hypothetical protein K490DRAFT_63693 [Saccharata proteae CBS 121410]|uniref:Uncharacterized protein n=1 Tax=Saccharata proteae CBS 121410 TaxID=1314787 RepID=A0A6A5YFG4_9PEZI|nr:hypothetical protein K490DRAFT_63693 [Saccharata proteae CBS 121410]
MSLATHVRRDGQWIVLRSDLHHVLQVDRERQLAEDAKSGRQKPETQQLPKFGLLSRTIMRSPIINWIIPARVRNRERNDVVFIGEDFVHLKEILSNGHLRHVATKADLGARIRAVRVFGEPRKIMHPPLEYDSDRVVDIDYSRQIPPQLLALTLESLELVFLFANERQDGHIEWWKSTVPLEAQKSLLEQPGKHLAVDPRSRAVAVSASEKAVFIYSARNMMQLRKDFDSDPHNWTPVRFERPIAIAGAILKMEFLYPNPGDEHTVILLVVHTTPRKRTALSCFEWDRRVGLTSMRAVVESYPLHPNERMPILLIPLQHGPNFMLVGEKDIYMHQDIMTGQTTRHSVSIGSDEEPRFPASSRRKPVWTSWARTGRNWITVNKTEENFYLMREDGVVHYMQVDVQSNASTSKAGHLDCSVDTAFASLDVDYHLATPDVLVAAGDMTSGEIVRIGMWRDEFHQDVRQSTPNPQRTRAEIMEPHHITSVQNWAPTMDLIITHMPDHRWGSQAPRQRILATAGRAPYGSVMELRHGHDAMLDSYFDDDELVGVTGLWTFPDAMRSGVYIVFAFPTSTSLIHMPQDGSGLDMEFDETNCGLEFGHETLMCAALTGGLGLQVTTTCINVVDVAFVTSDEALRRKGLWTLSPEEIIIKAAVCDHNVILAVQSPHGVSVRSISIVERGDDVKFVPQVDFTLNTDVTCLQVFKSLQTLLVATADGAISFYKLLDEGIDQEHPETCHMGQDSSQGSLMACQTAVLLESQSQPDHQPDRMLVLGFRNGDLYTLRIPTRLPEAGSPQSDLVMADAVDSRPSMDFTTATKVKLGHAPASLAVSGAASTSSAIATCGSEICRLDYKDGDAAGLQITNVWFTDRVRPSLQQFSVSALNHIPRYDYLVKDLGGALLGISHKTFFVAQLDDELRTVPRRVPVEGTPNRVVYSEYFKTIFVGGIHTVPFPNTPQRASRAIIQTIDERPGMESTKGRTAYELSAGARINSLIEWVLRIEDGKKYSLIVAGTTEDEGRAGKVICFQQVLPPEGVMTLRLMKEMNFKSPVFSLASFRTKDLVVCAGKSVSVYSYSPTDLKLILLCSRELPSSGYHVTTDSSRILISTAEDSLMSFELVSNGPDDSTSIPELRPLFNDRQARVATCHLPVSVQSSIPHAVSDDSTNGVTNGEIGADVTSQYDIALISDKTNSVTGILRPTVQTHRSAAPTLFEASFPRSITRLRRGPNLPPWREHHQPGVLVNDMLGSSSDGSIFGFSILDEKTWRFMRFLQNLCADFDRITGYSLPGGNGPLHGVLDPLQHNWPGPEGVTGDAPNEGASPLTRIDPDKDFAGQRKKTVYHVDGDILMRFLDPRNQNMLSTMLLKYEGEEGDELRQRFETVAADALEANAMMASPVSL